jgi:hypothetical protein
MKTFAECRAGERQCLKQVCCNNRAKGFCSVRFSAVTMKTGVHYRLLGSDVMQSGK